MEHLHSLDLSRLETFQAENGSDPVLARVRRARPKELSDTGGLNCELSELPVMPLETKVGGWGRPAIAGARVVGAGDGLND